MKDYADMNLQELQEAYLEELNNYKDQIPNNPKYLWLKRIGEDEKLDPIKVRSVRGYLMGIRDCGRNIGDLKMILEMISIEIED